MNLVFMGSIAGFPAGLGSGVGALIVFCIRRVSDRFLDASLGLALADGANLLVVSKGVIPEAHSQSHHREATFGVIFGFIVMMVLENAFS